MDQASARQPQGKRKRSPQVSVCPPVPSNANYTTTTAGFVTPDASAWPLQVHADCQQSPCSWPTVGPLTVFDSELYRGPGPAIYTGDTDTPWTRGLAPDQPTLIKHEPNHLESKPLRLDALHTLGHEYPTISTYAPHQAVSRVSSIAPSTISQPSSAGSASGSGSVLSPVCTTSSADWFATEFTAYSRGASPSDRSATPTTAAGAGKAVEVPSLSPTDQKHGHQQTLGSERTPKRQAAVMQTYICNWTGCSQPSFASKDGLTWHVKLEHLVVCPVPGCLENSLQSVKMLESHIRCAHPEAGKRGDNVEASPETPKATCPQNSTAQSPPLQSSASDLASPAKRGPQNDRVSQHLRSIATVKKRCRGQLEAVVERRLRRKGGTTLTPETLSDLVENASFPMIWEHGVLPFLIEFVPSWCGPKHVISITRGKTQGTRRVCIMTARSVSRARRVTIASHVRDLLPEAHKTKISFVFSTGAVERLVWARGLGKDMPDEVCLPRNPFYFPDPCMGDSIGIQGTRAFNDSTATLGPCLVVGGGTYWLANFHPFLDAFHHIQDVAIQHPSPVDRERCMVEEHDTLPLEVDFSLGKLTATSGIDLETTRLSHDPYWDECDQEPPLIVTDWILISSMSRRANLMRRFPSDTMPLLKQDVIKDTAPITPGAMVFSTGRTSGQQRGQICEIPAYVSAESNGTGKATREWFVEEAVEVDDAEDDEWIRGGIGCPGDSGAAIVDADSSSLLGQLWGRNAYFGPGPRVTYFTPITDLFDDIQERCAQQSRPQLPTYRDDSDRYPVYPGCRRCYDLRTYLDSRRSSRESLRSMIGGVEDIERVTRGDVMSLTEGPSELATPKDHSYWLKHAGDEVGGSFHGASCGLSPAGPGNLFGSFSFAQVSGTPKVVDARSPYATTLSLEEMYETTGDTSVGTKRQANDLPLTNSALPTGKRPRIP